MRDIVSTSIGGLVNGSSAEKKEYLDMFFTKKRTAALYVHLLDRAGLSHLFQNVSCLSQNVVNFQATSTSLNFSLMVPSTTHCRSSLPSRLVGAAKRVK